MRRSFAWLASLMAACSDQPNVSSECAEAPGVFLSEDFEVAALGELYGEQRWTQVFAQNGGNAEVTTDPLDPTNRVLRAFGPAGDSQLVKANLQKKSLCFSAGNVLRVRGRHLIPSGFSLAEVFLVDAECEVCEGDNPGPRLQLKEGSGRPRIDRGKLGLSNLGLAASGLPRDRWFELTFEVTVGDEATGRMRVIVDDTVVVDEQGQSAPEELLLDNVQVALTASASPDPVELYLDDVVLELAR